VLKSSQLVFIEVMRQQPNLVYVMAAC